MQSITQETTVGEIVRARPATSRVFESLGIDYCCGGGKPLAEACQARSLALDDVLSRLAAVDGDGDTSAVNPDALSLAGLCDHIQRVHHEYLRQELPRLDFMTRKVAAVHGEREPRLREVRQTFEALQREMTEHLAKEESTVFPAIRSLETSPSEPLSADLLRAFGELETEHTVAGAALEQFRELTDGFAPPSWACNTFRALYDGLAQLERDMHQHVHKENNVLFPRIRSATSHRLQA